MPIISGEYEGVYNSLALGYTQDGYRMEVTGNRKGVTVDKFGDTEIDGVYRGVNVFVEAIFKEWDAAGMAGLWWPYHGTVGTMGLIGRLEVYNQFVKALVLTAVAGSPAATEGPASVTGTLSVLDAEFARQVNFNNEDRSVPVRIRLYPNTSTGVMFALT